MRFQMNKSWKFRLAHELQQPYFSKLANFVKLEYSEHTCFPKEREIFAAFDYCSFEDTKVVIIGQDPYHGPNQANGLCFSVKEEISHPSSLINIFKEIEADIGRKYPKNGSLEQWAKQGVLLLNATLTVRSHQAGSHQNIGWEKFTDAVIKKLSDERENLIFLLWGGFAKKKSKLIDLEKHHVLTSGHPSPLSANRGYWFGNKHFSQANSILTKMKKNPIIW